MAKMFGTNRHKYQISLRQFKFAFKHKEHWHKELEKEKSPLIQLLTHPMMTSAKISYDNDSDEESE